MGSEGSSASTSSSCFFARRMQVPGLVVPEIRRGHSGEPEPTPPRGADRSRSKALKASLRSARRPRSPREPDRQRLQQKIGRRALAATVSAPRAGLRDLDDPPGAGERHLRETGPRRTPRGRWVRASFGSTGRARRAAFSRRRERRCRARGERDLGAQESHRALGAFSRRSRRWRAVATASSSAPASYFVCAARPAHVARAARVGRRAPPRARGMPQRRPSRPAPAPGRPPRSSSVATSSSGPAAASARCQARRSGSTCASVASANARCTRRRCSAVADR